MARTTVWEIPQYSTLQKECRPEKKVEQLEKAEKFWQEHWTDFARFWYFYISVLNEGRKNGNTMHNLYLTMQKDGVVFYLGKLSQGKNLIQLFNDDFREKNMPKGIQCFFEGKKIPDIIEKTYIAMQNNSFGRDNFLEIFLSLRPILPNSTAIDVFEELSKIVK